MACRLLTLPFELRDSIWSYAASTYACNNLVGCCRQTRDEFRPLSKFPFGVQKLIGLRIWVDSSYVNGGWLKLHYSWAEGSQTHRQVSVISDLRDGGLYLFLEGIRHVSYFEIHLVAPRKGHFVGALLMMLAKLQDAYRIILAVCPECRYTKYKKAHRIVSPFSMVFRTEEGDALKSTPFWECRAAKDLANPMVERDPDWGSSPFFYEYFMANLPRCFKVEPKFRFGIWPRPHISTFGPGPRDVVGVRRWARRMGRDGLALFVSEEAVKLSKHPKSRYPDRGDPSVGKGHRYEYITADVASLAARSHLLIDTLVGPVGGPLDMLRLHRFKEMDFDFSALGKDLLFQDMFAGINMDGGEYIDVDSEEFSLSGPATRRLRDLFDPFASDEVMKARSACPHLAEVEWSQNMIHPGDTFFSCPRDMWLQFYPNGIRHVRRGKKGGSLVEWRPEVRATTCKKGGDCALITWLYECVCCCEASFEGWTKVSPKVDYADRFNGWKFFRSKGHNTRVPGSCCCLKCGDASRPVMMYRTLSGPVGTESNGVATDEARSFHLRLSPKCLALDVARGTWADPGVKRDRWREVDRCSKILCIQGKDGIRVDMNEAEPEFGFCCWWHRNSR